MADNLPLVSVILPAYQAEATLARALRSALQQDYSSLEVIIADDGSTDTTRQMAEEASAHDHRIQYVWQVNGGAGSARNLAISKSTGEYIAFLDADDEWLPGKLRQQVEILARDERIGFVFSDCVNVNTIKDRSRRFSESAAHAMSQLRLEPLTEFDHAFTIAPGFRPVLYQKNFIATSSVLMRRSVFDQVGPFALQAPSPEDLDLWLRAARCIGFAYCDQVLAVHYYYSASVSWYKETWLQALVRYYQRGLTAPEYSDLRAEARTQLRRSYQDLIIYYGRHWKPLQGFSTYRSSLVLGFDWNVAASMIAAFLGPLPSAAVSRVIQHR